MTRQARCASHAFFALFSLAAFLCCGSLPGRAGDSTLSVQLDTSRAGPRVVESLTRQRILRDYRFAWRSLSEAVEFNTLNPLNGPFVGDAKRWLSETVTSQQKSGISQRYTHQSHELGAVFYAPEGDVIELHDTARYELEIFDAGKAVDSQPIVVHYVVLMTPGSDRWVIRQLQAVPQF